MVNKITLFMESTKKEPEQTIGEIQILLKQYGVRDMLISYDDYGEISAVSFTLQIKERKMPYRLPVNHRSLWKMAQEGKTKYIRDEKQARRVAWRQIYRWLEAQIALVQINMVDLEEIFLPYLLINEKETIYDKFLQTGFKGLLSNGK